MVILCMCHHVSMFFFCDLNQLGHKNHWQLAVKFKDRLANIRWWIYERLSLLGARSAMMSLWKAVSTCCISNERSNGQTSRK